MNPFIKRPLEDHIKELEAIKAVELPRIAEIDIKREQLHEELKELATEKIARKLKIINKEKYVRTLSGE